MKIDLKSGEIHLTSNYPIRLQHARGLRIHCRAGTIWITQYGVPDDILIHPGESCLIQCDGLTLVESIREGQIRLEIESTNYAGWQERLRALLRIPAALINRTNPVASVASFPA